MTTTAHEDMQSWIDSRNGWMERAEAAEAELLAGREDNHSMMLEIDGLRKELAKLREQKPALYMAFSDCGNFIRYWTRDTKNLEATMAVNDFEVLEFYAAPVPAPAVPAAPEHCKDCGMRWTDTTAHANMCVAEMLRQAYSTQCKLENNDERCA